MQTTEYRSAAYDPAHVNAVMIEARRMRNDMVRDWLKALVDGRFLHALRKPLEVLDTPPSKGAASHS